MNEWRFSGELFYKKPLDGEFAGSLKIRGLSKREGAMSAQLCELSCLVQQKLWEQIQSAGIDIYTNVSASGHLETWTNEKKNTKTMFIADSVSKD